MSFENVCGRHSDCQTIDHTDDEALNNARIAFSDASNHETTEEAVGFLLDCTTSTPSGLVMIVGHGEPGQIITGTGEEDDDQESRISLNNDFRWKNTVDDLKGHITELTLCSCYTGAGTNGANLLRKIADKVDAKVWAFTGLIFIDSDGLITCEEKGEWRYATPGFTPSPRLAPEYPIKDDMLTLRLQDHGDFITLPISAVTKITYSVPQKRQDPKIRRWKPRLSLREGAAQELVSTVNFDKPRPFRGEPLAIPTARLEIELRINQTTRTWRFVVFNDRLLQDESARTIFYFASPEFIKEVSEHIKPSHNR